MLEAGRALRARVPRRTHGQWTASPGRPDPLEILSRSNANRLPELVPVRNGRMMASPFAYYRGSPAVMAADLSRTPSTGIRVADLRRRASSQLRNLRHARTQPGLRSERLRRDPARTVGMGRQAAGGQLGGGGQDGRALRWRRQDRGAGLRRGVSGRDGEDGTAVRVRGVALPSGRRVDHRRRSRQAGPFPCRKDRGQGPPAHQPAGAVQAHDGARRPPGDRGGSAGGGSPHRRPTRTGPQPS